MGWLCQTCGTENGALDRRCLVCNRRPRLGYRLLEHVRARADARACVAMPDGSEPNVPRIKDRALRQAVRAARMGFCAFGVLCCIAMGILFVQRHGEKLPFRPRVWLRAASRLFDAKAANASENTERWAANGAERWSAYGEHAIAQWNAGAAGWAQKPKPQSISLSKVTEAVLARAALPSRLPACLDGLRAALLRGTETAGAFVLRLTGSP